LLIVGERINASRKAIRAALERLDAEAIAREARSQADAGAHYIDVNGGTFPGREPELLAWLVDTVQHATDVPLCLDSSDPAALAAALPRAKARPPLINSITLDRFDAVLPLVREHGAKVVALCQSEGGPADTAQRKSEIAAMLVGRLADGGIAPGDIYVDPLVFPVATDSGAGAAAIAAIGRIMQAFPGVHTICGLTNVSHGLPARRLLNRSFLVAAMSAGLDAVILDPTDRELMASLLATEALLGRDEYCMALLKAHRAGRLEPQPAAMRAA
jgi:5-methyltetrahydrofolate--homocysteine methyltransferase